jgi:hypothetical protein
VREAWLGHRAWKEVEDQEPLLAAHAKLREQRVTVRIWLMISTFMLCLALGLVALIAAEDRPKVAPACVGFPTIATVGYLFWLWSIRVAERGVAKEIDRIREEKERARLEQDEPPG